MSSRPPSKRRPPPPGRRPAGGRPGGPPRRKPQAARQAPRRPSPAARRDDGSRAWYRRPVALWLLLPVTALLFAGVVLFSYFFTAVPLPPSVGVEATVVLDQAGREVAELQPQASREDVALADLPDHLRHAVLAAEDANFYEHAGVSLPGIFRAALVNLTSGEISQGGSTISQQYVKNVTDQREQTALRKIREAALAVKLERQFSKDEILEFYLNTIYFGRGAYGIQAAANAYFGKSAAELGVAEAAQLAGIIPAPSALEPTRNPDGAARRYRYVLDRMVENGWLPADEARRLAAAGPPVVAEPGSVDFGTAPFFMQLVERELARRLGEDQVYRGLTVTTTLDVGIQEIAERHFEAAFAEVEEGTGALVSVDPATGGIRALVSGREGDELNLVVDARRQAGSTFKPFALAAWIEQGNSPESTFPGPAEMEFTQPGSPPHVVHNYGGRGFGRISLREATWNSVNTVYAQLTEQVGPAAVVDIAQRAGVERELPEVLSVVLGSGEVSPLDLAVGFNTFATGGVRKSPFTVSRVERDGQVLFEARPSEARAFSEQVAWTVTDVLQGVIQRGTARAADIGRPAAGKTGTTQNYADAWFAGYTPHLTSVVWMGQRDSNTGLASEPTGGGLPARLWGDYMREALAGVPPQDFPEPSGSLEVVGPTAEPEETETAEETEEPVCPEGQVPVSGEDGEDGGDEQAAEAEPDCAPSPSETASPTASPSPTETPSVTESPTPTESASATEQPTASPSPEPEPTQDGGPADGDDVQTSGDGASPSPTAAPSPP